MTTSQSNRRFTGMTPTFLVALALLTSALSLVFVEPATAFQAAEQSRWDHTATDGSGLLQGDPTTLTWGFVADGTALFGGGESSVIDMLDTTYAETDTGSDLTQRTWWPHFNTAFNRWGEVSGVTFVYEPNDDGSLPTPLSRGFLGFRADMRIIGQPDDGPSGTLAANFFPDDGEMYIDTEDTEFFMDPVGLQQVIMHEAGHGLGLPHVESFDMPDPEEEEPMKTGGGAFLMEPVIDTSFFGPQFDDILAIQRQYGDVHEKSNNGAGNDIYQNATSMGVIPNESTVTIGSDARPSASGLPNEVEAANVDFISIDGLSDSDFISFEIVNPSTLDIELTPLGPVYPEGSEFEGSFFPEPYLLTEYDTSIFNNLSVQLFDTDGTTQLASDNTGGMGEMDSILGYNITTPGVYYVRVEGEFDDIQMYELALTLGAGQNLACDADGDGDCEQDDINAFYAAFGTANPDLDFDNSGQVDTGDISGWLAEASMPENAYNVNGNTFVIGDANFDGSVNSDDLGLLLNNFNSTTNLTWMDGNLNGDGVVDSPDLGLLLNNFNFTSAAASAVPEPDSAPLMLLAFLGLVGFVRRRS